MKNSSQIPDISQKKIHEIQQKIIHFYQQNKRDLPWRNTTDAYYILLSEVMLQQTQVSRVIFYFETWTKTWPTIHDLAQAPRSAVLRAWMGLGYNSRAVRLHQTANIISRQYQGDVLKAMEKYQHLPGIGPYTATAVRIFAANDDVVTVDTNIRRILIHEFELSENVSTSLLWELARRCLPKGRSREWHNALMDYGSLVLTSRKTKISPITQQSAFQGSDRQIRGKILRNILEKPMPIDELHRLIDVPSSRIDRLVHQLHSEDLLTIEHDMIRIKETE